jgi:N-formylglutamate amidohydrolase
MTMAPAQPSPAFDLIDADATGPVLLSVPHAGRDYRAEHRLKLRTPVERVMALEDRLVDELMRGLDGVPALVARLPRAWIDLNRHEAEIDPGLVEGAIASRLMLTPKVRSGLGLVPRRLAGAGEIWRSRLTLAEVEARIATVHRPYHAALRDLIDRALATQGVAVLLDLHSMPPLTAKHGETRPRIVIGNRFGQTAAPWLTARIAATCARFDLGWRENSPYAGGHIVERHGAPLRGVHAIQLEVDRSLYLDPALDGCDPRGLAFTRDFIAAMIADLNAAALDASQPLAAE